MEKHWHAHELPDWAQFKTGKLGKFVEDDVGLTPDLLDAGPCLWYLAALHWHRDYNFESEFEEPDEDQPEEAMRTIDGRYHKHGQNDARHVEIQRVYSTGPDPRPKGRNIRCKFYNSHADCSFGLKRWNGHW